MNLVYEYTNDPFCKGQPTTLDTLKQQRIAESANKPSILEPALHYLFLGLFKAYWTAFMGVVWVGYRLGEYLEEVAA